MDKASAYFLYGVAGEERTVALLDLAESKGVNLTLKDIKSDPKALADFQSRGQVRFPIVVKDGKPAFTYVGDYDQSVGLLTAMSDPTGNAPSAGGTVTNPIILKTEPSTGSDATDSKIETPAPVQTKDTVQNDEVVPVRESSPPSFITQPISGTPIIEPGT